MGKYLRKCRLEKEPGKVASSHLACLMHIMSIGGSKIKAIKFADDQAIVSGSAKGLQKMVNKINCTAKKYKMKINASKKKNNADCKNKDTGRNLSIWLHDRTGEPFLLLRLNNYR